jgi:sulfoxide reductase heme-binding subunit YedZ
MTLTKTRLVTLSKPLVFLLAGLPLLWLLARTVELVEPGLGANPVETLMDELGIWGLRILLLTLAITPVRVLTGANWLARFRRMAGLWAFTYCLLHFLVYLLIDQTLYLPAIFEDILERPFITLGFSALMIMVPMAVTSTAGWRRRLGRRWNRLHMAIYVAGILVCWHFYWQVKKDITEPLIYCLLLAALLGWRLMRARRRAAQ